MLSISHCDIVVDQSLMNSIEIAFAHLMEDVDPDSLGFFIDSQGIENEWDFSVPPIEEMFGYVEEATAGGLLNIDTAGGLLNIE